ncbi:MAG: class I SAM-dependent methyltransferase [Desulfuromonadales bacterium]|nr:class I SAM-dependent methyltransferase [Desulfuromonadales bacterium]MDT8423054.1 class I SAM-dependent methyltransferase [Desulfuromonadales bacterium]
MTENVPPVETVSRRNCPVCHSGAYTSLPAYSKDGWHIVQCLTCKMVYLENPPAQNLLKTDFAWEGRKDEERRRRRAGRSFYYFFSDRLKRLRGMLRRFNKQPKEIRYIVKYSPGRNVLDVGCGDGNIISQLPDTYVTYGIEPSPQMAEVANDTFSRHGGLCIHDVAVGGFAQINKTRFDFILMRSFLEHDSEAMVTLQAAHSVLSEQGGVLIKVPNFACWNALLRKKNWPGMRYPDHVNYFTPSTLKAILSRTGFSRVYMPLSWRLPSSDNLWVVAYR